MALGAERDIVVDVTIKSDTRGAKAAAASLGEVERGADNAGRSMRGMTKDSKALALEVQATRKRIAELGSEFARTKDRSLFGDLRKERSFLRELIRIGDEADQVIGGTGRKLFDFGSLAGRQSRGMAYALLAEVAGILVVPLGAMIAGAVIGGVGLGGIVGGTIAAAKDPRVREAFGALGKQMGADIKDDAAVFVDPLVSAAGIFGEEWVGVSAKLETAFRTLAPGIEPLARGIGGLANELAEGFNVAAKAAVPIMQDMEEHLTELGASLKDFLTLLSDKDTDARGGFGDLIEFIRYNITGLGALIAGTGAAWSDFKELPGWAKALAGTFPFLLPGIGAIDALRHGIDQTQRAALGMQERVGEFNPRARETGSILANEVAPAFDYATAATDLFNAALATSTRHFMDWIGAEIEIEDALDDFTESVQENGRTLDIDTEAGRENVLGLKRIAEAAAEAARQKYIETGSVYEAQAVYDGYRQKLYDTFIQLGYTADEAQRLTDKWLALANLPDIVKTITWNHRNVGGPTPPPWGGGLQEFATGGYVAGPKGSAQLAVVHAGERVLTEQQQAWMASAMGGGNSTITIVIKDTSGRTLREELIDEARLRNVSQTTIAAAYP